MLNLALVAALSGSLLTGSPDGDRKQDKDRDGATAPATELVTSSAEEAALEADGRSITHDTYAFGIPSDMAPIKLWVAYAYGESEQLWNAAGDDAEYNLYGNDDLTGDIVSQRIEVGAQINVINFSAFKLGFGGQLNIAMNEFQFGEDADAGDFGGASAISSDFGLQQVKMYASARGRTLGIHGGYLLDLADTDKVLNPQEEGFSVDDGFAISDERDAIFFGADFDYPSERFRLFAGLDYFLLQDPDDVGDDDFPDDFESENNERGDIFNWTLGAGIKFSVFELGAALLVRTQFEQTVADELTGRASVTDADGNNFGSGGHARTVAPYLRISPPSLPASLFIKGAVLSEYTDYGYALDGGNDIQPGIGFTAGLTVGFE